MPQLEHIAPAQGAGRGVDCNRLVVGRDIERLVDHQEAAVEDDRLVEADLADLLQIPDIVLVDLIEVDIALGRIVLVDREPVVGRTRSMRQAADPARSGIARSPAASRAEIDRIIRVERKPDSAAMTIPLDLVDANRP